MNAHSIDPQRFFSRTHEGERPKVEPTDPDFAGTLAVEWRN